MYQRYFPKCTVNEPIEPPVAFAHFFEGAIPKKCSECNNLFEGECLRAVDKTGYLHLDYGDCGISGPTDPVIFENRFITSKVYVPRKCSKCVFLKVDSISGFICTKDKEIWGAFARGLDWGSWSPDHIYLQLEPPKVTTRLLSELAFKNDKISFIKEYRRVNPELSMQEAVDDFKIFRNKIMEEE